MWDSVILFSAICSLQALRERQRGAENSGGGGGNFGVKPLPKNVLDSPPTIRFPPLFWRLSVISLKREEAPTRPTSISEASKSGFGEHALQYVLPPSQIQAIRFPPLQPLPNSSQEQAIKNYSVIVISG